MADPFATAADVATVWRALTPAEEATTEFYLEFASEIIRMHLPSIDARIAAGTLSAVLVKGVVVAMAKRALVNPEGLRSVQRQIEDYSETLTRDASLGSGGVFLSADELAMLSTRRGRAFSITPHAEPVTYDMAARIAVFRSIRDRYRSCDWWMPA